MIRDTNLLSIIALIISVAAGSYIYLNKAEVGQEITDSKADLTLEIKANTDAISKLQTDLKTESEKAAADNEELEKKLAATDQSLSELDKKITTLCDEITKLDGELDATNEAIETAKAEAIKAAVEEMQKNLDDKAEKDKIDETISDLKTTNAGEVARGGWLEKFSELEADYLTLSCYSSELFTKAWYWPFSKSYSLPPGAHSEISAVLLAISKLKVSTLDAKGITSMNTTYQPMYDEVLQILTNAHGFIVEQKKGDSNFAKVVEGCGGLQIIGK